MPFDSRAARESAEVGNEAGDTRASLAEQFNRAQSQLGFGAGASNPYGDVALNQQKLVNQQRANLNTAGNSLYAGSTLNAAREATSNYDRRQKEIDQNIAQAQSNYAGGQAKVGREEALQDAAIKEGAINRAAATEPQPLAPGSGQRGARGRGRTQPNNRGSRGRGRP